MPQQLQALPNAVFLQPEFVTTAVPIAVGAGTLALQNTGSGTLAGCNTALLTFASAHGYTAVLQSNGTTLISNTTTNHVPMQASSSNIDTANYLLAQITGATVNTAVNSITFPVIAIPSTTTMLIYCTLSGTNPTVTSASFIPVFALSWGEYNILTGANCVVEYNPDNTGSPVLPPSTAAWPTTPVFRTLLAVSSGGQFDFDGYAAQTIVVASGSAGTTRWSEYFR
jgi:hypothetical protein